MRHRFNPQSGRSSGGGNGNPLQYSCLENPMDKEVWQAIVHRVTQSQTRLKGLSKHYENYTKKASNGQTFKEPKWYLKVLNERRNSEHVVQFSSVQFSQLSRSVVSDSLQPHELQHARPPCPSPTPGVHSDSRPSSQRCHPAISSSVVPFFSCPQSLPASESFPMSQLFAWGGQSTGVSALASFLPRNTQDWSLEWSAKVEIKSTCHLHKCCQFPPLNF